MLHWTQCLRCSSKQQQQQPHEETACSKGLPALLSRSNVLFEKQLDSALDAVPEVQ
jgi:hypothetical protein